MRRLAAAAALGAALALLPLPGAAQEDDRGFLVGLLEDNLSGAGRTVRIEGFQGALSSRATMRALSIADDAGVWITLNDVALQWNRGALLAGRVEIAALTAAEILLPRLPQAAAEEGGLPAPEASGFSLPELPVAVAIGRIAADRVEIGAGVLGQAAVVALDGSLTLDGGEGAAVLQIARRDGRDGRFAIDATFANASRELRLDIALAEGPGGIAAGLTGLPGAPALELALAGGGPPDAFRAGVRLATDGRERVAGNLTLSADGAGGRQFRADLGGEVAALVAPAYQGFFGPETRLEAEGTAFADGRIEIAHLAATAAAAGLAGRLSIGADGLPTAFDLTAEVAAAGGAPVLLPLPGGPTRVGRAQLRLGFDAARSPDWTVTAEVRGLAGPQVSADRLALTGGGRIVPRAGGRRVLGAVDLDAEGLRAADPALAAALGPALRGRLEADWQEGGPLSLPLLRLAGEGYAVEAAVALQLPGSGPVAVEGRAILRHDDLARLSGLAGQALGGGGLVSIRGRFEPVSGAAEAAVALSGRDLALGVAGLDGLLAGQSRVAVELRRDATGTTVRSLSVRAATLALDGAGSIRSAGSSFDARLSFADVAVLGPGWGGAAEAELTVRPRGLPGQESISLTATGRDLATGVAELDRLLAGESRIALAGAREGAALVVDRLEVAAGALTAVASGRLSATDSAIEAEVAMADLAALGPPWGGRLAVTARALAGADGQRLEIAGTADDLALGLAGLDRLFGGRTRVTLDARRQGGAVDIAWATVEADGLAARASGRLQPGASDLAADLALADLGRAGRGWGGSLALEARLIETGAVRRLRLGGVGRSLRLGNAAADAILAGETRLLAEAEEQGGRIRLNRLALTGPRLSAEASGTHDGTAGEVTLSARLADLAVLLPGFPGALTAAGTIGQGPAGLRLDLRAEGPGGIAARLSGRLAPDFGDADLTATGEAQLGLANPFILPRSVAGAARFDLALRGPLAAASLSGQISAAGARLVDPAWGAAIDDLALSVALGGGRAVVSAAGRVKGGGRVALEGPVALAPPYAAELAARLERARVTDPALFDTRVSGALTVAGPLAGGATIAGTLRLEETELRIPDTGLGGGAPIPKLRHAGEPAAVRATRARAGLAGAEEAAAAPARPYALALRIEAPRRVFIRGRGLDAELGGALELGGTTAAVVPAGGFALIRGRLDLLGRRFQLTEGQAQLQGRFVPYLRLAAVTEAEGIAVRIEIEGEADDPTIRVLSSPDLPEEEVLARLLFGKGIEHISALQAARLAAAVATLAGRGGEGLVGRLRRGFGLDDLDVTTGEDGTAAVRAGRYLTENVYTDLTVGADGRSAVRLNIDVSPSLTLRGSATSDGRTGIGLFWERDY